MITILITGRLKNELLQSQKYCNIDNNTKINQYEYCCQYVASKTVKAFEPVQGSEINRFCEREEAFFQVYKSPKKVVTFSVPEYCLNLKVSQKSPNTRDSSEDREVDL